MESKLRAPAPIVPTAGGCRTFCWSLSVTDPSLGVRERVHKVTLRHNGLTNDSALELDGSPLLTTATATPGERSGTHTIRLGGAAVAKVVISGNAILGYSYVCTLDGRCVSQLSALSRRPVVKPCDRAGGTSPTRAFRSTAGDAV